MATTAPKKVIVMTGGNIGIGFECAKLILSSLSNVHLVLGCRDSERAAHGVSKLKAVAAESNAVESKPLELASFASVRQFAEDINTSFPQGIHTLILNAGLMACSRRLTEDKHEMNMQVNHLSQFLLAQLLLPSLRTGQATWSDEPSSVIFVSSSLHKPGVGRGKDPNLTMENVDGALEFDGMLFYRNSKLCQAMCMHLMAASLKDGPVTVNAICPGFVPTTDLKRESGLATRILMDNVVSKVSAASTAADAGARVFEAISKDRRTKNGLYFDKEGESKSSEESCDPAKQKLWWNWTCQAVGLDSLVQ